MQSLPESRTIGDDFAVSSFPLKEDEIVFCQPGAFLCGENVTLDLDWGDGILDPITRSMSGEGFVLLKVKGAAGGGHAVLGANLPGRLVRLRIKPSTSLLCRDGAYVAHTGEIRIRVGFTQSLRVGLFAGEGWAFQRLEGDGDVFIHALGAVVAYDLEPGRVLRGNHANLLAFQDTVGLDIGDVGDVFTTLWGGMGFQLLRLEGVGKVIFQGVDPSHFSRGLFGDPPTKASPHAAGDTDPNHPEP